MFVFLVNKVLPHPCICTLSMATFAPPLKSGMEAVVVTETVEPTHRATTVDC